MKEKDLTPIREISFEKNDPFDMPQLKELLAMNYEAAGIPYQAVIDEVKLDGLFKGSQPCLVVSHPDHSSDYYYMVFYREEQKKKDILHIKVGGKSKHTKIQVLANYFKSMDGSVSSGLKKVLKDSYNYSQQKGTIDGIAYAMGGVASVAIGAGVKAIGKKVTEKFRDNEAYQAEMDYYNNLIAVTDKSLMG